MLVLRLYNEQKQRQEDQELILAVSRIIIADHRNFNRGKGTAPILPSDIFKLSYDTQVKKEQEPDLMERLKKKYGDRLK